MSSLKDFSRRAVTMLMGAAMATAIFSGCTPTQHTNSEDNIGGDNSSNNSDSSVVFDDSFGIKYKYWYDNVEAEDKLEGTKTNDSYFHLTGLPIYRTADGKFFVKSGKVQVEIENGKIVSDTYTLRTEDGYKVYYSDDDGDIDGRVDIFNDWKSQNGYSVDSTMEERMAADMANGQTEKDLTASALLYVNDLVTNESVISNRIYINDIYRVAGGIGKCNVKNGKGYITLFTAAGEIELTIEAQDGDTYKVSYSTDDEAVTLVKGTDMDLDADKNDIWMTPSVMEQVLGYDVEVCEGTDSEDVRVNVVTDTYDKFKKSNIVSEDTHAEYSFDAPVDSTSSSTTASSSVQPEQSTPSQSSSTQSSSSSTQSSSQSTPVQSSSSTPTQSSSQKPVQSSSSKPAETSSSKPAQSSSKPASSFHGPAGEIIYENTAYGDPETNTWRDTPSDTTGWEVDSEGFPIDRKAWREGEANGFFFDKNGIGWVTSGGTWYRCDQYGRADRSVTHE